MIMNWLYAVLISVVLGILVRKLLSLWARYRQVVSTMADIDGDPPHWLFGNLRALAILGDEGIRSACDLLQKYPKCQPVWLGPFMAYLRGYHPDFMKSLLNADAPKDDVGYRFLRPWIGNGMITSAGEKWKRIRRLVTPAFHFETLKRYLSCMNRSTTELLDIWREKIGNNSYCAEVEVLDDLSRLSLDVILRCILSKESGCQREATNEYLQAVKCLTETVTIRMCNLLYYSDAIFYMTSRGKAYKRALKIAHDYTSDALDERLSYVKQIGQNKRLHDMDFLDILINAKDDTGEGLSRKEICEELDTFIFAGHETISSALSWTLYNLAVNPVYQDRCRNEVNEIIADKSDVQLEDLSKLTYLTMFIKESMRLYSPVFSVGRTLIKPLRFPRGFGKDQYNCMDNTPFGSAGDFARTFPENTMFNGSIQCLHCNPHIWKNPFEFDPERFTKENCNKRSPFAYLPFSAGPRNCIGQNFAMNEMKVVLSRVLSTFKICLNDKMPKAVRKIDVTQRSETGIHLKLKYIGPVTANFKF